jgi:hypothetical protein
MSHALCTDLTLVYWGLRTSFCYRNQQPGQAIWSGDGSILAVAQGCFVTLWSVATNALYRLFTSVEIHNFTRLTFVGRSDRYLCAAGHKGIAVFDLIRGESMSFTVPSSLNLTLF